MRAMQGDRFALTNRILTVAMLFLALWGIWFFGADVALYESTDVARIEVERASFPLQAVVSGRVVASNLVLGRSVHAGDVLIVLDAEPERRELDALRAHRAGVVKQIAALRNEMSSRRRGLTARSSVGSVTAQQARALYDEAESNARFAEEQATRMEKLAAGGNVSDNDLQRYRSEARSRRSAADARRIELARIEREEVTDRSDRQVDIERLEHDIASLEGEVATTDASMKQIEEQIDRHVVRAPGNGTIGEVGDVVVGAVVEEGEKIGAIVPEGALRVVASFPPPSVFGRISIGQHASMRLAGFPWTEYGGVHAMVKSVGSEVRDGFVRVELEIDRSHSVNIPLQHGLPGSVEIEVDRVTPAMLVLRTIGRYLDSPVSRSDGTSTHTDTR